MLKSFQWGIKNITKTWQLNKPAKWNPDMQLLGALGYSPSTALIHGYVAQAGSSHGCLMIKPEVTEMSPNKEPQEQKQPHLSKSV